MSVLITINLPQLLSVNYKTKKPTCTFVQLYILYVWQKSTIDYTTLAVHKVCPFNVVRTITYMYLYK